MNFFKKAISVSALGLAAMVVPAMAVNETNANGGPANSPSYNPATLTQVEGVVTAIRQVPGNDALSGVHVTLKAKNGNYDVLVGPAAFLKLTKTNIVNGEYVQVRGSLLSGNVIMGQEFDDNTGTLVLRDAVGTPVWILWGM